MGQELSLKTEKYHNKLKFSKQIISFSFRARTKYLPLKLIQ